MNNCLIALLFVLFSLNQLSGQNQASQWYFGNYAALDFMSGAPVSIGTSAMAMLEGVSSIADASGNLLFYTNGSTVWNANNTIMPNGTGLSGNNNSAQAALIIPYPGNTAAYIIVTTPTNGLGTMDYSIIDMTLNGGLGDVVIKNTPIVNNSTEKVTAVAHSNGTDIWIIGHTFNTADFYAYLVTSAGVSNTPVISTSGSVIQGVLGFAGYMKASHCGQKVAYASTLGMDLVELFDFDNSTGIISNAITFPNVSQAYGLEFSGDDSKLYATLENPMEIFQWDLNAGSAAAIIASQVTLPGNVGFEAYAALQLGTDSNIYLANRFSNQMGVINEPNQAGAACNFIDNAFTLSFGDNQYGLPNLYQSLYTYGTGQAPQVLFSSSDTVLCEKQAIDFNDLSTGNPTSWQWTFTGASPSTATDQNPMGIYYAQYGTFPVTLKVSNSFGNDSVTIQQFISVVPIPNTPTITATGTLLCCDSTAVSYQWFYNNLPIPNATNICYTATQVGNYYVTITDTNGCENASGLVAVTNSAMAEPHTAQLAVYPNPANDQITLYSNSADKFVSVTLYDVSGKEVTTHTTIYTNPFSMDIAHLPPGYYTIAVWGRNTLTRIPLIKIKP
ncbi:MAG: PKD domain-containing protein [Bacteroidetes bacterium]|nr:PKD domain-containing protein [Bacteroidota bacterium]